MVRKKKFVRTMVLLSAVLLLVVGCTTPEVAEVPAADAEEAVEVVAEEAEPGEVVKMKVGIMTMGLHQPYFVALSQGYKDVAEKYSGVDVEIVEVDPKNDPAQQVAAIENFIQLEVDAIIITAIDPEVVNPVIKEAMVAGIKVVAHYNVLAAQDLHSGISTYGMGFVAGQEAARWINEQLGGKAEVGLLIWDKTEFDIDRTLGMKDALAMYAPDAEVVAEAAADGIEVGLSAAETIIQAHPEVDVFVCYNDEGCLGALGAVEAAGLASENFGIFGVNASPEALDKIKEGTVFRGTASIDPYHHGRLEMEMAIRLVLEHFLPSSMEIVPVPVNIDNVDRFME
jgi:ABC-type sugar transport system substrate-binding protein